MKNRVIAMLLATAMACTIFVIPAFATAEKEDDAYFEVNTFETASVYGLYYTQTVNFSVPGDGDYHRVRATSFDIAKGDTVDISTTWGPAATSIWIDFRSDTGDAVAVHLTGGNGSATLTFPSTGLYYLNVMSDRYAASGTISLTW